MDRKPLIIAAGQIQQLPAGDDIDAPVKYSVDDNTLAINLIIQALYDADISLPDELLNRLQ